jgi:3-oxoacyl-[acyl-carrier-protein] synthase III
MSKMARKAQIISTARYLPEHAVTNAKLTERFTVLGRPTVIDRLANSTGIKQRFYAPDGWATSDLAVPAAKEALKRAGRKPEDEDLIIVGTTSPDYVTPDTSVVLQHKLGAKNAGIFDVDCACASFPALIAVASGLIATTAMRKILVVGVDMIHKLTDPSDPGCFLWSDGAGAAVLEGGNHPGFIGAAFQADGAYASGWGILAGGTFEPASIEAVKAGRTQMRRAAGNYPASVNEENWPRLFERLCAENDFKPGDVDQLLFTQISKPSIAIAAKRCNVPLEKCHTIMEKYGYTGSACIPMALDDAIELGKIKRGDLVVMLASGLGWNQTAAAVRMTI